MYLAKRQCEKCAANRSLPIWQKSNDVNEFDKDEANCRERSSSSSIRATLRHLQNVSSIWRQGGIYGSQADIASWWHLRGHRKNHN